ncbi:lipoprotein releasing system permease (plasmid) [Leptospira kobayashii]|uniref:Lipoprotein releasing system permease n=1 Tax=Leptospira kobayashii TaxID=1917830 RepID=A0ABM7UTX6_9LEPT|nr:ABC transporter permease [Leptospira kobayashii]BDA80944.1 lipoprotein releasing system permease [Leptospira kobayashii]
MVFLAIRQIFSRPQQTILTIIGIMLGTAGYVMFSGIMLGFQTVITEQLINSDGQIKISPRDEIISEKTFEDIFFEGYQVRWLSPPSGRTDSSRLTNVPGWMEKLSLDPRVLAYTPQLTREVIYSHGKSSSPARIIGIDPLRQANVTNLEDYLVQGKLKDLNTGGSLGIIGDGILTKLGAKVGDTINVITPLGTSNPLRVVGILRTGNRLVDDVSSYASIASVQNITQSSGEISQIVVKIADIREAASIADEWSFYSKDKVESWDQANESILSVFKTQDIVRNSTTFTIILVVAFGIYNILNMVVNQKKKEVAILRSIGFDGRDTIILFLIQGIILGTVGAIIGLALGAFGCYMIEGIPLGSSKGEIKAVIRTMQISWSVSIYIKAFLIAITSASIASFIPARMASHLSPVEIIRGAV